MVKPNLRRYSSINLGALRNDDSPEWWRMARLLKAIHLVFLVLSLAMSVLFGWLTPLTMLCWGCMAGMLCAFLMMRRGYIHVAGIITVIITMAGTVGVLMLAGVENSHLQMYLLMPILLASVLLPTRPAQILTLIQVVGMMLLDMSDAYGLVHLQVIYNPVPLVAMTIFILVLQQHRNQVEEDRYQAYIQSEARLRSITNTISDMIVQADASLRIQYVSPSFVRTTGWPIETLMGITLIELEERLCHPDDLQSVNVGMANTLIARENSLVSHRFRYADGSYSWIETAFSVSVDTSHVNNLTLSSRDITDRKTAEEMRALDQVKDSFLSMVAHELRGPLSSIMAYTDIAVEKSVAQPRYNNSTEYISRIQGLSQQMHYILEDLLDLARLRAKGQLGLERRPVSLVALIADECAVMSDTYPQHRIIVMHSPELPLLELDYIRINQVLRNLLSNAAKYSPPGSTITITTLIEQDLLHLSIQDEGMGIDPEQQKHLFEPFYRTSSVTHLPGTGLGLAISRTIVELHGGTIQLQSAPNCGSTFTLMLPLNH